MLTKFSERLMEALAAKGWSQSYLAKILNTTQPTVNRWVKNINEPDLSTLLRICYYLDEDANYMIGYDELDKTALEEYENKNRANFEYEKMSQEGLDALGFEPRPKQDWISKEEAAKRKREDAYILRYLKTRYEKEHNCKVVEVDDSSEFDVFIGWKKFKIIT